MVGKKIAIVGNEEGVTRDIRVFETKIRAFNFQIFDTAGIVTNTKNETKKNMTENSLSTLSDPGAVLFMLDGRQGILPDDFEVAKKLRKKSCDVILVVNKCESSFKKEILTECFSLGFGEPIQISAEHGHGIEDLKISILEKFSNSVAVLDDCDVEKSRDNSERSSIQISIVGRPNSGKSTLFNLLLDDARSLTGPESGLTRDAVGVFTKWNGDKIKLFDTAGMRKKNKIQSQLEKLSVQDSIRAINFSEVVIILLDLSNAFDTQDLRIAEMVGKEGRLPIFAINKWDLEKDKHHKRKVLQQKLETTLPQFAGAEIVPVSAKTGLGISKLYSAVKKYHKIWDMRVATADLNFWLSDQISRHPPPVVRGKRLKIRYVTQVKSKPPTFIFFGTRSKEIPKSYERYLINNIRISFGMIGVPIRVIFRSPDNPYSS